MNRQKNTSKLTESWHLNAILFLKMILIYVLIIFGTEAIFRKSIVGTLSWIAHSPFLFLSNIALLVMVSSFLLIFSKRIVWVTIGVGAIATLLSFVNIGKFALRNVPLLYEDFFLVKEVWVLMPQLVNLKTILIVVLGALVLAGLSFLLFKFFKNNALKKHRVLSTIFMSISLIILLIGQKVNSADLDISKTGFLYSLSNNTRASTNVVNKAQLEAAGTIFKNYVAAYDEQNPLSTDSNTVKPNIIVIQSEAFWDINKMGIEMSKNPISFFESLRKESHYGELYVPVVGGGTSNTEYEILTGMTLKNYSNDWYMVYPNEIKSPTVSLASILRKQGYEATAIHPYMSWYYNRLDVYKYLGFNEFRTIEFMNQITKVGEFASDQYTTEQIIEAVKNTEKPLFNFAVTMQNHGPYGNLRFNADEFDIDVTSKMSDSSRYFLHNYVQGLYLSDQSLENLVTYLRDCGEPTILVFYGDHLPMLGEDYQAFRDVKYIGNEDNASLQVDLRMMAIPYVMWKNYDDTSVKTPTMNASYMTSYLLKEAGLDMPDYLKALYMSRESLPLYFRNFGYDVNGNKYTSDSAEFINAKALYLLIHDDLKKGKGVEDWLPDNLSDYNKALSGIQVSSAEVSGDETKLEGVNFYESMVVTVNGEKVDFALVDSTHITIKKNLSSGNKIEMKLYDTEQKLLGSSTLFVMP
ncbi:LTA synthase family protein [Fusibacter bizertensis]